MLIFKHIAEMIRNKDPELGKICVQYSFETQKSELTKALKNLCYIQEEEDDSDDDSSEDDGEPNIVQGVILAFIK